MSKKTNTGNCNTGHFNAGWIKFMGRSRLATFWRVSYMRVAMLNIGVNLVWVRFLHTPTITRLVEPAKR